ncbi:hypothetical protein BDR22DRAFT_893691 [Usnea florida]
MGESIKVGFALSSAKDLNQLVRTISSNKVTKYEHLKAEGCHAKDENCALPEARSPRFEDGELDGGECVQNWLNETDKTDILLHLSTETVYPSPLSVLLQEAERRSRLDQVSRTKFLVPGREILTHPSTHDLCFRSLLIFGTKSPSSALNGFGWKTFRRLEFDIWELECMAVMSLFVVLEEVPRTVQSWILCESGLLRPQRYQETVYKNSGFPRQVLKGLLLIFVSFVPYYLTFEDLLILIGRPFSARRAPGSCITNARFQSPSTPVSTMEEERTNLVPRLQQDAYFFAAAQPGQYLLGTPFSAHDNCAFEIASNHQSPVAAASNPYRVQVASATGFSGGYQRASSRSSAFPYSVGNFSVINESSSNNYAPFNESHSFAQGLPAAGIANRYLADSFNYPYISSFDTNASSSAQPHAFSTGALSLTSPTYAESGYDDVPPALQYYSGPSNYNEHPFTSDAASIGNNTFATPSANYTNGHFIANSPFPMAVSNNPVVPMDVGFAAEGPTTLSPDIYTHTLGQVSAINPLPMPTSNNALIPVDGPPIQQRALCTQCPRTFSRLSDLERHAKKHLPGPKEFKCHAHGCKYESHRKDKLVEHMRRRHPAAGSHSN